jgi:hypothetical protein
MSENGVFSTEKQVRRLARGLLCVGHMMTSNETSQALQLRNPRWNTQRGKIGWALLWLLGVPLPVLLLIYLIRGH